MIEDEVAARQWVSKLPGATPEAVERLTRFAALLREENEKQNLVARNTLTAVWQRHIADSAQLLRFVPRETSCWLDLGTGAGFPGIIAAILLPGVSVQLVEARGRRVDWLRRARDALALSNVTVIDGRLESVQSFDAGVISARAFAPLPKLLELSAPFSTTDTIWLLPKGRSAAQELSDLKGWRHSFHVEQSLTDHDAGIIVGTLTGRA